jgi:hypothetical protein
MNKLERFNAVLDRGFCNTVFFHLRNFLMCAFLLAIGTNEFKEHTSILFGYVPSQYSGLGVIGVACILIGLNLYDGIRKISRSKYHLILTVGLVVLYIIFSTRVIEMAWDFRITY